MDKIFKNFHEAHTTGSGPLLSATLIPAALPEDPNRLRRIANSIGGPSPQSTIRSGLLAHPNTEVRLSKVEGNAWVDVYIAYWKAIREIVALEDGFRDDWSHVYSAWRDVTNILIKGYNSGGFESWTVPCLYVVARNLRTFAIKADIMGVSNGAMSYENGFQDEESGDIGKNKHLSETAGIISRIFTLCLSDRSPLSESRKWGLYYTTNLLFKTYFKLNRIGLSKSILRAIEAGSKDLPPIESFPKSHIVTFKYYLGVILFLEEDYIRAEENLTVAWKMCHRSAQRNKELILTYLIPCHLLTTHTLPMAHLLAPYPRLQKLFGGLGQCIKRGDLAGFDAAMAAGEDEFVKRRIYLTLERGRDIALRNLLRKVYLAGGYEEAKGGGGPPIRRTRIPVVEFAAAIRLGSKIENRRLENDEVECLLANMIYKNLIKGYIARDRGIVVLSKNNTAFPGTGV